MATDPPTVSPRALALLAIVLLVTFLYSVFIMAAPLAWVGAVLPVVGLYLLWRFVRAHERIAAALESQGASTGDDARADGE
jgi:uncharacterized membrane protein